MPRLITMGTLVTRCKQRADMESDDFISTAEWKSLISEKYGELYGVVVDTGSRYFESSSTITATGATSYAEPSDHSRTIGMDRLDGTRRCPVFGPIEPAERHIYSGDGGTARYFAHVDDQIILYPNPTSGTYYLLYVPQATDLSAYADGTAVDVCDEAGESFLIWGVSIMAKSKGESDVRLAMEREAAAKERLVTWAARRRLLEPRRKVIDTWIEPGLIAEGDWPQ